MSPSAAAARLLPPCSCRHRSDLFFLAPFTVMAAAAVTAPPSAASSSTSLLITPYTPPRDVLVWDRDAKCWLRIDLGNELEPTVEWLSSAITRQLGHHGGVMRIYLGGSAEPLTLDERKRPIEYFTFGQSAVARGSQ